MMSTISATYAAASTENDFRSFASISLKPLLKFITSECLASMPTSGLNVVDFVMQLLEAKKGQLYQMCRCSDQINGSSSIRLLRASPLSEKSSPEPQDCAFQGLSVWKAKLNDQLLNSSQCQNVEFLRQKFDSFAVDGSMPASFLHDAMQSVFGRNRSVCETRVVQGKSSVDFDDFRRIVALPCPMEQWAMSLSLPRLVADAFPFESCTGITSTQDVLHRLSHLSCEEVEASLDGFCKAFRLLFRTEVGRLKAALEAAARAAERQQKSGTKFQTFNMSCGTIENFYEGLVGRVGAPQLDFDKAIEAEHVWKDGSLLEFTTDNYNITTNPKHEYELVMGKRVPLDSEMTHGRRIPKLKDLMRLPTVVKAKLQPCEVIVISLYSGPMFKVYNSVLRRWPAEVYKSLEQADNLFSTTIFVLVSGVQKLSRCTHIPKDLMLYRGLGGLVDLPDRFFQPDEQGCFGYTEWGFMSCTAEKNVALQYSGIKDGKPHAMVLAIQANSTARGARIEELSQYPSEVEYLFVPCAFLQPKGEKRVEIVAEGIVSMVPVDVSINIKSDTIEELLNKRKTDHLAAFKQMLIEAKRENRECSESKKSSQRLLEDPTASYDKETFTVENFEKKIFEECTAVLKCHENTSLQQYVDYAKYSALVREMLDTKKMSLSKLNLWLQYPSVDIAEIFHQPLRSAYRTLVSMMLQGIQLARDEKSRREQALALCKLKGFVRESVFEKNELGENALATFAADGSSTEDMRILLIAGAKVDATDSLFQTPLFLAAQYGHIETVSFLLSQGANPNSCARMARSPTHIAAFCGHSDIIESLAGARANVDARDAHRASSLLLAAQQGHVNCVDILIQLRANIELADGDGCTPLFTAAEYNHPECIRSLAIAKAHVNCRSVDESVPIHVAATSGFVECVKVLVELGADIDAIDKDGFSPMHLAAQHNRIEVISFLISSGGKVVSVPSSPSAVDLTTSIQSPLAVAKLHGHLKCAELLESVGALDLSPNAPQSPQSSTPKQLRQKQVIRSIQKKEEPIVQFDRDAIQIQTAKLQSSDIRDVVSGMKVLRRMTSLQLNPSLDDIIEAGVVPFAIRVIQDDSFAHSKDLQMDALWLLTNIAAGTSYHTRAVVEAGAIPLFCRFLACSDAILVEQAIWALGNIAGDSVLHRDTVLASGCMALLLAAMDSLGVGQLSLLRNATWTLSNFCRGKPPPDLDLVMPALPTIARLILSEDQEIVSDACWATSYISDGDERRIEAVLAHVPLDHLVQLLSSENEKILTPALRLFGNILTGNDDQTDRVIQCGILPHLRRMLFHHKKSLRKEACWSLSNITAGTALQVAAVIACDIIPPIVNLLSVDDFEVQIEAAWCISNTTCSSDPTHIEHLVQCQCLRPMVELLSKGDSRTSKVLLEAIRNILRSGHLRLDAAGNNPYILAFEQCGGIDAIELLQHDNSQKVMRLARDILENYIGVESDVEDAAGPAEFNFPSNPAPQEYHFDGGDAST